MNSELTDVGKWRFGGVSEMSEGGRRGGGGVATYNHFLYEGPFYSENILPATEPRAPEED